MAKKRGAKKAAKGKKASRTPRSRVLPGLAHTRVGRLDNLCEAIGDERELMNKARTEEKGLLISALQTMQQRKLSVYRHGGVELARVPGAERLRVRLTKEEGDAGAEDLETIEHPDTMPVDESPSDEEERADAATGTDGE